MIPRLAVVLVVLGLSNVARADDAGLEQLIEDMHASVGGELTVGSGRAAIGFRGAVSTEHHFGDDEVRPAIGIGFVAGGGEIDGTTTSERDATFGEGGVQLVGSLRFHDDTPFDSRVFVTLAVLRTGLKYTDGQKDDGIGERIAFGGNWLREVAAHVHRNRGSLVWVLPHQAEVVYEHDFSSHRVGAALSYGF
jgi:hypothetical protein